MAYNALNKLQDNIAALRIALAYKADDILSDSDLIALRRYAGFGGIKAILFGDEDKNEWEKKGATATDMRLWEPMQELFDLIREHFSFSERKEIMASLKNSVLTAFYTPAVVPETLYKVLNSKDIRPQRIYEPSAGAGIFITEAAHAFEDIRQITAVEKDILTGKVLQAIVSGLPLPVSVHISPLEQAPTMDNGDYDLVISNIPFGNFPVYDKDYPERHLSERIHNYFFAKGLDKLGNGGLLAFITTDGFLNSPGNKDAREYLFRHADLVSVSVMPDNLMKESGGTEAPSHLLIVQRNDTKEKLSDTDELLIETVENDSELGKFCLNNYVSTLPESIIGSAISVDTNQYGKAHQRVWQEGPVEDIAAQLEKALSRDCDNFLNPAKFRALQYSSDRFVQEDRPGNKKPMLTYTPMPADKIMATSGVQLGLFDIVAEESLGRVGAYLDDNDKEVVNALSAKIGCILKTTDKPEHETVVLVTAKAATGSRYVSKLFSNATEIRFPAKWLNVEKLALQLEQLADVLKGFDHEYVYQGDPSFGAPFRFQSKVPESAIVTELPSFYRDDVLYIHNHEVGLLQQINHEQHTGTFTPFVNSGKNLGFYERYISLRDNYYELFTYEHENEEDAPELRRSLNNRYESFVAAFGKLNQKTNSKLILNDQAFGFVVLSSLERRNVNDYVPADILKERLSAKKEVFNTENIREALAHCLNEKGDINIDYIARVTGKEQSLVIEELGDQIFFNPQTKDWETADKYLSGNVLEKLRFIEPLINEDAPGEMQDRQILRSYEAIKKVQPQRIPFELLDFNFGERWLPMDYYSRFASDFFELDSEIYYLQSIDTFKVKVKGDNAVLSTEYAITPKNGRNMYGDTLMEHALRNTSPFFTYEVRFPDNSSVRKPDNEATQLAFSKIESIRQAFLNWMNELPEKDKDYIENLYHEKYNCYVLRKYDGSHLTFPGLDLQALRIKELYPSQKDAAWRIIQEKGALIDHIVGLGKTLTMIISTHEMKRLGIIQKPMLTGIKANIPEIAETYRKAYPQARVLYPGPADFTPAKRKRIFYEIKNNNWDCIILSHEQFLAIEQSAEIQKDIIGNELDGLERDLDTLKKVTGNKASKRELNGLEVRKLNLAAKLAVAMQRIESRKDDDIDFKTMGIDMLFVDESHKFKNLLFTTRHNRVAGLGNQQGSQRALNLLFAVRTLQQRYDDDKGVTFLSGTPISNSLTELFLIFKYLRPRALERLGMSHFDGWAAVYARKTTDFEFSVTNEIIAKERFRHFIKVPELALFYNEITDYKTDKHIHQDRPELEEVLVNIRPTDDQENFTKKLIAFAKTGDGSLIGIPPLSEKEDRARMLIATNYAKKMAVDMRLVNPYLYDDDPENKISKCAEKFAGIYAAGMSHKVTQMVFSDIGTPKPGQFNVYDALKDKLVNEYKIPAHEIAFIHDWQGPAKRAELYRKMNAGEIRGLFGSTEMAGTGLNVQERLIAEHHLDVPWTPKDLEQRYGRMARPGNIIAKNHYNNKVTAYLYATEKSLDNYKFNLLKNKQTFISQMKNNELQARTLDEGAMDEQSGMNFSEYIAILSGDTTLLEKAKLEKKVKVLENLKAAHYKEISRAKWNLQQEQENYQKAKAMLVHIQKDAALYKSGLKPAKDGSKYNDLKLGTMDSSDPEALGRRLIKLYNQWKPDLDTGENFSCIGTIYGFNAMIEHHSSWEMEKGDYHKVEYNKLYAQRPDSKVKYSYNKGWPNTTNPKLAARYFIEAIDRVRNLEEQYLKRIAENERSIPQLTAITVKTFDKETELISLKEELASLERKIAINIQANELERQEIQRQPQDDVLIRAPDAASLSEDMENTEDNPEDYAFVMKR